MRNVANGKCGDRQATLTGSRFTREKAKTSCYNAAMPCNYNMA